MDRPINTEMEALHEDILMYEFWLRCTDRNAELVRFLKIEKRLGELYMKLNEKVKQYEDTADIIEFPGDHRKGEPAEPRADSEYAAAG